MTDIGKGGILILLSLWTSEFFIIVRARQWLDAFTCTAIVAVFLAAPFKLIPANTFVHLHAVIRVGVTDIGKGGIPILFWLWTSEMFKGILARQYEWVQLLRERRWKGRLERVIRPGGWVVSFKNIVQLSIAS